MKIQTLKRDGVTVNQQIHPYIHLCPLELRASRAIFYALKNHPEENPEENTENLISNTNKIIILFNLQLL